MPKEWIISEEDLGCDGAYFSYDEVVRCKECESWGLNAIKKDPKGEVIYGDCLHFCVATPKEFYCAWGERREGDKEIPV